MFMCVRVKEGWGDAGEDGEEVNMYGCACNLWDNKIINGKSCC